tara:strand:- start:904 stop:1164 length:261 start_codon:yes stop_codon:yes gene_type:complete
MNINELIAIIKKKLKINLIIDDIRIEDKTHLHKKHSGFQKGKFHLKIEIHSDDLKKMKAIESNKIIYKILDDELKKYIHSLQISIR